MIFANHHRHTGAIAAAARAGREDACARCLSPGPQTHVTNRFQKELEEAFSRADEVCLGPVHRGGAIPTRTSGTAGLVQNLCRAEGFRTGVDTVTHLAEFIAENGREY
jgi:hypothetical protein